MNSFNIEFNRAIMSSAAIGISFFERYDYDAAETPASDFWSDVGSSLAGVDC